MKLTLLLIAFFCFNANAYVFSQSTVTLRLRQASIPDALEQIQAKSSIRFVYSDDNLISANKINLDVKDASLHEVLNIVLLNSGFSYRVLNADLVVIYKTEVEDIIVNGKVVGQDGRPILGVTVTAKGTSNGTLTSNDGSYRISLPSKGVLVFSYLGFLTQEVGVNETKVLNITLLEDFQNLNEVVVLGYGTQRKRDVTGSTSTVSAEQITQNPVMSPEQGLQGRAPGVRVMQSNGAPGGAVQVQIRGVSSTSSSNQPLYVLDGIPLFDAGGQITASAGNNGAPASNLGSPLANINPNDIESMEVLKDASATAIYGARASNGVILITTKRGKAGKTSFNLDYYNGVQQLGKKIDMLNAVEGMQIRNAALLNVVSDFTRNIEPEAFNPYAFGNSPTFKSTDWQNEIFRPAGIQDANLSASGGTDKIRYMVSGNYMSQKGIVVNSEMNRATTRINLDINATDRLKFGTSTSLSFQKGNDIVADNPFQGTILGAVAAPAFTAAYNADGTYFGPLQNTSFWRSGGRNGVFEAMEFTQNINRQRANSNVFGEYEIVKGLKFKSSFGVDYNVMDQRRRNPSIPRGPQLFIEGPDLASNGLQRLSRQNRQGLNWVTNQVLSYGTILNEVHQLDGLLGFEAQSFKTEGLFSRADGSLNPLLTVIGTNLQSNFIAGEGIEETGIVSQFARFNYGYGGKYLITGTLRRDGSSKFGPKNRYALFPSVGLGWRVSEEKFFEQFSSVVSNLKFRASYGITGNQEIGNFAFLARTGGANYTFGNTQVPGAAPINFANESLKWEENEQTDIGIDLGLFKGRVDITADYYVKNANDLLFGQGIPITSGFGGVTGNLGKIQNKGFEFAINTVNTTGAFKWNTSFNISTQENKVISLGDNLGTGINQLFGYGLTGLDNIPANVTREGLPIASFFGLVSDGIFQTQAETVGYPRFNNVVPQPGDLKIRDVNKDGVITLDDRVVLGSPFPDYFGGLSNDFSYKNFSLNVFANFSVGNKIFNQQRLQFDQGGNFWGGTPNLTAWNGPGSSNDFPRVTLGAQSQVNRLTADRWLEDGSFLRIRNITLGYNLPERFINRYKMKNVRLYTSVSNAFTFTKYKGWDPEVNSSGSAVLSSGIDQTGYPVARTFQLGINLGF